MEPAHVRDSFRRVDENSWLLGGKILLRREPLAAGKPGDDDGRGFGWKDGANWYSVSDAPSPLPESSLLSDDDTTIKLVYDAGDKSAVFSVGSEAFCKTRILDIPEVTQEHTTLAWLHERPWSFALPTSLYHAEFGGRYYHFLSRVPGQTIDKLWPDADEATRDDYVDKVVQVCKEMRATPAPEGHTALSGIDGNYLAEFYLCDEDEKPSPAMLRKVSGDLGMDCTRLVFYHTDMGPTNVLVDTATGKIGVVDWETAGWVPEEWIRTKFRSSSGMDLHGEEGWQYRKRVQIALGKEGFTDVADAFFDRY